MRTSRVACLALTALALAPAAAPAAHGVQPRAGQLQTPSPRSIHSALPERPSPEVPSPFGLLSPVRVDALKAGVGAVAAGLLLWGAWLRRAGRPDAHRRPRDLALLGLGLVGALCWWNLGRFHYPHYAHRADNYLYFVGAKYLRELGHDRLYHCTAVAEAEAGRAEQIAGRPMRDLVTNEMTRAAAALEARDDCKRHFSDARWRAFRADVEWFRARIGSRQWRRTQMDHGYNATPVWGILAVGLANTGPASGPRLLALTLLDPLLLALMWASVVWAFGWRPACVAAVFWGTNPFAHFGWTGGAYLRQDWLVATIVSLCLLRRGRSAAAGFALMSAALLRVFPLLVFAGIGLAALLAMAHRRRLRPAPEHLRFGLGALAAAAVLVPLSAAVTGLQAWPEFLANSRQHLDTPLQNSMGLKTVLSHDPDAIAEAMREHRAGDPFGPWKEARRATFRARRGLFYVLVAGFALLLARAVADREDWVAAALGIGLVPIAGELTCYYYSVLLAFGLLWTQREGIGVALCALAVAGWFFGSRWHAFDEIYALSSVAAVAFVIYATATFAFGPRRAAEEAG